MPLATSALQARHYALTHPEPEVSQAAAFALGRIGAAEGRMRDVAAAIGESRNHYDDGEAAAQVRLASARVRP